MVENYKENIISVLCENIFNEKPDDSCNNYY